MIISELNPRLGGDPRGFPEYAALREELAKLSHPARPDVNWVHVEQLCLSLHRENGVELQSLVMMTLARSQLYGLPGVEDGFRALGHLLNEAWTGMWPPSLEARLEWMSWLFDQLQPLLRGLNVGVDELSSIRHVGTELARVSDVLSRCTQVPLVSLQALRQQIANILQRLERDGGPLEIILPRGSNVRLGTQQTIGSGSGKVLAVQTGGAPSVVLVALEDTRHRPPESRAWIILLVLVVLLGLTLAGGMLWWDRQQQDANALELPPRMPREPFQLQQLLLFAPGSATLPPEASNVLSTALLHLDTMPGRLVVITGHSDSQGDSRQNLELSFARAAAVRDWMQQMSDMPGSCFVIRGAGSSQPIAGNSSDAQRALNRRVDIELVPTAGVCVENL